MEDYIVRIYRRDPKNPEDMTGIVEEVGAAHQKTFHNRRELWSILSGRREKPPHRKRERGRRGK